MHVKVSHVFPWKSADEKRPGWVHWAYDEENRILYCSRAAFEELRKLPDADKDKLMIAMGALP